MDIMVGFDRDAPVRPWLSLWRGRTATGAPGCRELRYRNSRAFHLWWDGFAAAWLQALPLLGFDHGAGHKPKRYAGRPRRAGVSAPL
jgi:hypothetical protein